MKTRQQRSEEFRLQIDKDLQDRTSKVLVKEDECHRWDVRCYTERSFQGRQEYIGGTSSVSTFDKAMELANFYAPCKDAIRVEVGVAM